VKPFDWSEEKNAVLKKLRGITFDEIVFHITHGGLMDIIEHPNQRLYEGQRLFIVRVGNYAYLVPFVESENAVFLKTIIPNRKATLKYIGGVREK
jgi:hypothetical protein